MSFPHSLGLLSFSLAFGLLPELRAVQLAYWAAESQRIINGTLVQTPSNHFSYHALPTMGTSNDFWLGCGATIISPTYGMSAAHCFGGGRDPCSGPSSLALWLGDVFVDEHWTIGPTKDAVQSFRVDVDLICNPKFDGVCAHGNDIVLFKLRSPLPSWVHPVKLDLEGLASPGATTISMGYGLAESEKDTTRIDERNPFAFLRQVTLQVLDDKVPSCASVYAGGFGCSDQWSEAEATNLEHQFCAGATDQPERDTCSGDSGSPMITVDGVQVGIVSYGGGPGHKLSGPGRICADPQYPGVYTRVSAFKDFISSHVKDLP